MIRLTCMDCDNTWISGSLISPCPYCNNIKKPSQENKKGPSFDFGKGDGQSVLVLLKKAIKESADDMNVCDCPKCIHIKNIDEEKTKKPAIFEGYEVNSEHVLTTINGHQEKTVIKKSWQDEAGTPWLTYLSDSRLGFLDMKLNNFQRMFTPIKTNAAPNNGDRFFYITYSYFVGGRRGHKKDFIAYKTTDNQSFNVHLVVRDIEKLLAKRGTKTKHVLIDKWETINKNEYDNIMGGNNGKA